jgi:hypothetical protein
MDFEAIQKAMGRPPDEVRAAPSAGGAAKATAHQRLWWVFKDGSRLVIDLPIPQAEQLQGAKRPPRPVSADRPHAELHGAKGERLDQQGIVVPEGTIAAHMTITDYKNLLEGIFGPARRAPR